ncbi:helix-turn-helix domain-containing protein [Enterococcus rotai]|uniref:helix-turn-helix domain-containing protein n=1 Tax=Enterococcus rotai TaxID=118060 RepID=UPI0035C76743
MNIGETIKFFRAQLDFMQKELVNKHVEASSISRIEKGVQEIKVEALIEILNTMSLTVEEFFSRCQVDQAQDEWKTLVYNCIDEPDNMDAKNALISYYKMLKNKKKTLKEQANYFSIKMYFSRIWPEIAPISDLELEELYDYLKVKKYYQQYDYMIINNTILLMKDKQQEFIISRIIPIQDEDLRNDEVKRVARQIIINLVTSKIYRKDFVGAKKYLQKTETLDRSNKDYYFALNVEYLKNLLGYLITGEAFYMKNIHTYINLLEFIGDKQTLDAVKEEVKILTYTNKNTVKMEDNDFPVGVLK